VKPFSYGPSSLVLVTALILLVHPFAFSETPEREGEKGDTPSIVVKADSLEIDNKKRIVTFTGHVDAQRDIFTMYCEKMDLHYVNRESGASSEKTQFQVEKIVASGNVKIIRTGGGLATADKAIYYQAEDKVVLTGNPVVKQGKDSVEGSRITLYLKDNRSVVEGSENRKVKAVLFPK
jgi:lipopolysaccharide export system protein LptA